MSGHASGKSPALPVIDKHHPVNHLFQLIELHLAPKRCEKAHFSPSPLPFVVRIDLADRSSWVWIPLLIHHTVCDTTLNSAPFLRRQTHSLTFFFYTTHSLTLPSSLRTSLISAGSARLSWTGLTHHRRSTVCLQKPHTKEQSKMGSSISCVPQHNFTLSKSFIRRNR